MGEATQDLAQFAATLSYDAIPERVRAHCRHVLLRRTHRVRGRGPSGRGRPKSSLSALAALRTAVEREQRDWRRPAIARRRDHSQRLPRDRRDDVRHPSRDAHARDARGGAGGARDRRARRALRPRSPGRARGRFRGDDPGRHRRRLSGDARARLARAGRARAVRRRRRGRPPARLRCRHHGEGVRPRRQPVRRHLRGLGHADGEIPSMPRRAVRPHGRAACRAEFPRHGREFLTAQGRRPLQQLSRTAASRSSQPPSSADAGSSSRSRCACGRPLPRSRA